MLFRVLGPLQVRSPGGQPVELSETQQRLLAMLLLGANTWVDTDTLSAVLGAADVPVAARGNLRTHVHHLRQLLPRGADGSPRINSRSSGYRLNVHRSELDAAVFEDMIRRAALPAREAGDEATAARWFGQALGLWRDEPYGVLRAELGEPAEAEAARLTELRWTARDGLADTLTALGRYDEVVALLRPLTTEQPRREPTWERLVTALYSADRRDQALDAYHEARRALEANIGPRLRWLHERILAGDDAAAEDTQRLPITRFVPPQSEPSESEPPESVPPGDVHSPPADEPRPWAEWRIEQPSSPPPRRRRVAGVLIAASVLAVSAVLGIGAVTVWNARLLSSGNPTASSPDASSQPSTPATTSSVAPSSEQPATANSALPPGVSPRRAVPGLPAPGGRPVLLFGMGDRADNARDNTLVKNTPTRLLTTRYRGPGDLSRFTAASWRRNVVSPAYSAGFALHLVIADDSRPTEMDTPYGRGCGKPYPLSEKFLDDAERLARAFAGTPESPPLFVSVFDGVQAFSCSAGAVFGDDRTPAYYRALLGQYLQLREVFHQFAPNALVSLSWDSAQAGYDSPTVGGGVSMFAHFADALRLSDFVSITAVGADGTEVNVRAAVKALGKYGPVMLAAYGPPPEALDRGARALLADALLTEATRDGLFAISFTGDAVLRAPPDTTQFLQDAVQRLGRPAR